MAGVRRELVLETILFIFAVTLVVGCGGHEPQARASQLRLLTPTTAASSVSTPTAVPAVASQLINAGQSAGTSFLLADSDGISIAGVGQQKLILAAPRDSYLFDPAISPDGLRLAYIHQGPAARDKSGQLDFGSDLYVAGMDGRNSQELIHHGTPGQFFATPSWLPSGQEIVYAVLDTNAAGEPDARIEILNLDGMTRTRLINDSVQPALSPDGKSLSFVRIDPKTQLAQIMVYDFASSQSRVLISLDQHLSLITSLAWSPDGGSLAFVASNPLQAQSYGNSTGPKLKPVVFLHPTLQDIWLVNADGSNLKKIVDLAADRPSVVWSTTGETLYVLAGDGFWKINALTGDRALIGPGVPQGQVRRREVNSP